MSDDPTEWFRSRGGRRSPDDGAPVDGHGDGQPPTERMDAASAPGADGADPDSPVTQPLDAADRPESEGGGDGLENLFGDQRDYSSESDWLPPREAGAETPTEVQPTAPATDPLGWLGDGGTDDATTVAVGASGAGLGAGAAGAASPPLDDAVTQRFDANAYPAPPSTPADGGPPPEEPGSRRLVIILAIIGVVLVIAVILALVWFFTGMRTAADPTPKPSTSGSTSRSPSPTASRSSASPTPSATPTPTPTKTTPPTTAPVAAPTIGSFTSSPDKAACQGPDDTVSLSFSWTTSNASKVSLSIDGVQDPYNDQLSAAGTLSNVPYRCSSSGKPVLSQGYTLLATNSAGRQTSKQITITLETSDSGGDSEDGNTGD